MGVEEEDMLALEKARRSMFENCFTVCVLQIYAAKVLRCLDNIRIDC